MPTGGFTHMMRYLAGSYNYSINNSMTLVIDTKRHPGFGVDFHDVFEINSNAHISSDQNLINKINLRLNDLFPDFSEKIINQKLEIVKSKNGLNTHYILKDINEINGEQKYLEKMLLCSEDICITSGLPVNDWDLLLQLMCNLRLKNTIVKKIITFKNNMPEKFLAVHFRNTDYESDFSSVIEDLKVLIAKYKNNNIYIATDDISSIPNFKKALPSANLFFNENVVIDVKKLHIQNLHYASAHILNKFNTTKLDQHINFFIDLLCLINSIEFIPNPMSSVTKLVNLFKDNEILRDNFFGFDPEVNFVSFQKLLRLREAQYVNSKLRNVFFSSDTIDINEDKNKAINKPYVISSAYSNGREYGFIPVLSHLPYFFHTRLERNPWIIIDLLKSVNIIKLIIANRKDACFNRACDLSIEIYDSLENFPIFSCKLINQENFLNGLDHTIATEIGIYARFIKIYSYATTALHFSSIEVF